MRVANAPCSWGVLEFESTALAPSKRFQWLEHLFRGLEQYPELLTEPRSLRDSYLQQIETFIHDLKRGCRDQNIDYVQLRTDTPLNVALSSYLAHRLTRLK